MVIRLYLGACVWRCNDITYTAIQCCVSNVYATAPRRDKYNRVIVSVRGSSAGFPTRSGWTTGFMALMYSFWSKVIVPSLLLTWWIPTHVKSGSCSMAAIRRWTSASSPMILMSSTCLAIMRTSLPLIRCFTSHSGSDDKGCKPISTWHVTLANF